MVRTSKTDKQSATTPAPTVAPVVETPAEAVPKQRVKKVKATAAPEPVVENVQVAVEVTVDETSAVAKLAEFEAKIQQAAGFLSSIRADYKTLVKTVVRELKSSLKASSKKKKTSGNRPPSGFTKPAPISDELAKFLGKATGTEMARTDVSKELNAYICAKDLKDKKNGRFIHPDASLAKLLNLENTDVELSYFNLQRYIKHHFRKATVASV